ncbi:hypothetical protein L7E35_004659 [Vibrio parahaemolyticus]|nr:hypothetical protein [Vibrio parahaemolyticus]EIV1599713.1 hypothetical protein [Vibrio parahaemolyticus]
MKCLTLQIRKTDLEISKDKTTNKWIMPRFKSIFDFDTTLEAKIFMLILAYAQRENNIHNKCISRKKENEIINEFTFSLEKINSSDSLFESLHCSKKELSIALTGLYTNKIVNLTSLSSKEFTVVIDESFLNIKKGESYVIDYEDFSNCGSVRQLKLDILTNYHSKHNFHTRFLAELLDLAFTTSKEILYAMKRIRHYFSKSQFTEYFHYHNGKREGDKKFYISFVRKVRVIKEKVIKPIKKFMGYLPPLTDTTKKAVNKRKEKAIELIKEYGVNHGLDLLYRSYHDNN